MTLQKHRPRCPSCGCLLQKRRSGLVCKSRGCKLFWKRSGGFIYRSGVWFFEDRFVEKIKKFGSIMLMADKYFEAMMCVFDESKDDELIFAIMPNYLSRFQSKIGGDRKNVVSGI